ncbi:squalene/phytoene synthase family protein [Pseudomonadota bacterium]
MFCWEQVSRTNGFFRISRVFAPRESVERLLPLYALFSVVEQISSTVSDPDVAESKLNWWRNECLHRKMAESQHPLIRELARTGAANRLPRDPLAELFDGAGYRFSAVAPADMEALKKQCLDIYRPQLELELSVSGTRIALDNFDSGLLARNGLFQLVRESTRRKEQGGFWWMPLNSLAKHDVSRGDITRAPESRKVAGLFKDVLTEGLGWGEGAPDSPGDSELDFSPARHVFAISGLYARKLRCLAKSTPDKYVQELRRSRLMDLWGAWAGALRLR